MKISPKDIARSLVDTIVHHEDVDVDDACLNAMLLLRKRCPGVTPRTFIRLVEKEVKRRGSSAAGLLVVPHDHSIRAEVIEPVLAERSGKAIHIDRKTNPDLIGGAVLLIDHRRIDCSIQGALHALLRACLEPLD